MTKNKYIVARGRSRGMSIIEVMLTVAILGVLAAMATPSFTTVIKNSRIRTQASDLMVNLAVGRAESAKRNVRVTLCPSNTYTATPPSCNTGTLTTNWAQGYIVFADVNQNGTFNSGTDELIAVGEALSGGNTLVSAGLTANQLQFRASGNSNVTAAGGTFKLCDDRAGNFGRLITVTVTGRATSVPTVCP